MKDALFQAWLDFSNDFWVIIRTPSKLENHPLSSLPAQNMTSGAE